MKAKDFERYWKNLYLRMRFYPYRIGFGISGGFWPCIGRVHLSLYLGVFNFFISYKIMEGLG